MPGNGERRMARGGVESLARGEAVRKSRNWNGRNRIVVQAQQQLNEGLLSFADYGEIVSPMVQHPGVVRRDLRSAKHDSRVRPQGLDGGCQRQRSFDIPDVTGETDHPGRAVSNRPGQSLIAECVGQRRCEYVDVVKRIEPFLGRKQLQVGGGQRNITANGRGTQRRNEELNQKNTRAPAGKHLRILDDRPLTGQPECAFLNICAVLGSFRGE